MFGISWGCSQSNTTARTKITFPENVKIARITPLLSWFISSSTWRHYCFVRDAFTTASTTHKETSQKLHIICKLFLKRFLCVKIFIIIFFVTPFFVLQTFVCLYHFLVWYVIAYHNMDRIIHPTLQTRHIRYIFSDHLHNVTFGKSMLLCNGDRFPYTPLSIISCFWICSRCLSLYCLFLGFSLNL